MAQAHPEAVALYIEPSHRKVTYRELDQAANQFAHAMRSLGLRRGQCVGLALPNGLSMVAAILAALRVGLYYTLINPKASDADTTYICSDSRCQLLLAPADRLTPALRSQLPSICQAWKCDCSATDALNWDQLIGRMPDTLPSDPSPGMEMIYSSGSTGRPKGIRREFQCKNWGEVDPRNVGAAAWLNVDRHSVYLSTSPLYHSAPYRFLLTFLDAGATIILMQYFDAQLALQCIDLHRCTHSLWVPTMFQRMLNLPASVRQTFSGQSLTHAIHGAAPCPIPTKQAMIAWWGPVLYEYYSGTEGIGRTFIDSQEWLKHPGSVGQPSGCAVRIIGEQDQVLPAMGVGRVFFETSVSFDYWNDPEKTRKSISPQGWRTYGDIGYLDVHGYLYLTDRQDFMVISGGVNLYPKEIEDKLLTHPGVVDVAVFGIPDQDLGEVLAAVIELSADLVPDATSFAELQQHCARQGGKLKTPRYIRFMPNFPRLETGKVKKLMLRERLLAEDEPRASWVIWPT